MKNLNAFLSEVENHIDNNGFDDVLDLIPWFENLQMSDWESMIQYENGQPVNTTIYQSNEFRIIIICWAGKQQSSVHGHSEGGGLIKVLKGQLEETRFHPIDRNVVGDFKYCEGAMTYIHDMIALHQVKNPDPHPSFSLHVYTKRT